MMEPKRRVTGYLERADLEGLVLFSKKNRGVLRSLISLTYDKENIICWRAIEAAGLVAADMPRQEARAALDRVLLMMRDESGCNAWSAPETVGEIIRNRPEWFATAVPVLASFHTEDMFRAGVLFALSRIAEKAPELVRPHRELACRYLKSNSPEVKGSALLLLKSLGDGESCAGLIKDTLADEGKFRYYEDHNFVEKPLKDLAALI